MVSSMILALALASPQAAVAERPRRPVATRTKRVPDGKPKKKPQPHCEGETPDGRVASADKPVWGSFCRVTLG